MCFSQDDVAAAGGRDEDVAARGGIVHRRDFEPLHRRLQGTDRVDLGDQHPGAVGPHRVGAALADVAVAADHHDLAGDHDVGRPLDAVGQRLAAAVEVVELALRDRVVDVHGGDGQLAPLVHLVEAVDARGRLFRQAADAGQQLAVLRAVDDRRQVAAVVDDHVQRLAVGEEERLLDAPVVLGVGLALPGVDGEAGLGDGGGGMVLGRELVATAPGHFGAQRLERLDEHGRLDRHVQTAGNPGAGQWLGLAVLAAEGHQAGHFLFGELDLFSTPLGLRKISNFVRHFDINLGHDRLLAPLRQSSAARRRTRRARSHHRSKRGGLASPGAVLY